jgi:hypothetical protein
MMTLSLKTASIKRIYIGDVSGIGIDGQNTYGWTALGASAYTLVRAARTAFIPSACWTV